MTAAPSRPGAGAGRVVHVVVPPGVDDPRRPSGGNVYDRRVCRELAGRGWVLHEHVAAGAWPRPSPADGRRLAGLLAGVPDGATVLVDGLVASAAEALAAHADRLCVVVLLHMPLAEARPDAADVERAVLAGAASVVTTSRWARGWVLVHHGLAEDRVRVAEPGVDPGPVVAGSATGRSLLCVGAVTPDKGHDTLVAALGAVADLDWRCTCVGALDLAPAYVAEVRRAAARLGVADRLHLPGPLTGARLDEVRSSADLVVSVSRRESFGMAVVEGLARGIPVVATSVGGQPEAVGVADDGTVPGLLVPAGDADRLSAALRRWLTEPALRDRFRRAARSRRSSLTTWPETGRLLDAVLAEVSGVNQERAAAVSPGIGDPGER